MASRHGVERPVQFCFEKFNFGGERSKRPKRTIVQTYANYGILEGPGSTYLSVYLSIYLSIFLYMHIMHKKPYITQLFQVFCPSPSEAPGGCQDLGPHGAPELRGARGAPDGGRAAVPEPGGVPWTLVGQFTREKPGKTWGNSGFHHGFRHGDSG